MIKWTRLRLWGPQTQRYNPRKTMFHMGLRDLRDATDVHGQPSSSVSSASAWPMLEGVGVHFAVGVDRAEIEHGGAL